MCICFVKNQLEHWKFYISFVVYVSVVFCITFILFTTSYHTHGDFFCEGDCLRDHLEQNKIKHANFWNEYSLFCCIYLNIFYFYCVEIFFTISLLHIYLSKNFLFSHSFLLLTVTVTILNEALKFKYISICAPLKGLHKTL